MRHRRTGEPRDALIILGGTARKNGRWHSTLFEHKGDLGDRLRVEAAWQVYRHKKEAPLLIVSGGKGTLPDCAPSVADILSEELMKLGVNGKDIVRESLSGTTFEQLCACNSLIADSGALSVISNEYHLPRIRALITYIPELSALKRLFQCGRLTIHSAEAVLIAENAKKWKRNIDAWYRLPLVRNIIRNEKRGVREIKAGSYILR
ncbi:MAG: YdcF family protein [Patescibacteria group bacterium]